MENLSEADANILQAFGKGQGLVSGQAVRFPLLVKIDFDENLISKAIGDEDFLEEAAKWRRSESQRRKSENSSLIEDIDQIEKGNRAKSGKGVRRTSKGRKVRPKF
jgi:hypothetical protein